MKQIIIEEQENGPFIRVISDSGLNGYIYEYGNYNEECWRLMGFDDEDFEKAQNVPTSNAQLYKQAGNSIVVNVLEAIFKELFKDYIPNNKWDDLD